MSLSDDEKSGHPTKFDTEETIAKAEKLARKNYRGTYVSFLNIMDVGSDEAKYIYMKNFSH